MPTSFKDQPTHAACLTHIRGSATVRLIAVGEDSQEHYLSASAGRRPQARPGQQGERLAGWQSRRKSFTAMFSAKDPSSASVPHPCCSASSAAWRSGPRMAVHASDAATHVPSSGCRRCERTHTYIRCGSGAPSTTRTETARQRQSGGGPVESEGRLVGGLAQNMASTPEASDECVALASGGPRVGRHGARKLLASTSHGNFRERKDRHSDTIAFGTGASSGLLCMNHPGDAHIS